MGDGNVLHCVVDGNNSPRVRAEGVLNTLEVTPELFDLVLQLWVHDGEGIIVRETMCSVTNSLAAELDLGHQNPEESSEEI